MILCPIFLKEKIQMMNTFQSEEILIFFLQFFQNLETLPYDP